MPQTHQTESTSTWPPWRRLLLRPGVNGPTAATPSCMQRAAYALELMAQVHQAVERTDDQVVYGGVIFLNAQALGDLPNPDQASVHSDPLPPMDFYRWPISALARLAARIVRKFAAPFTKRQERFNLDLLESLRRLEARLETQQHVCRQLRRQLAELERDRRVGRVFEAHPLRTTGERS